MTIHRRKILTKFRFVLIEVTRKLQKLDPPEADVLTTDLNKVGKLNIHWFKWKTVT